jgi:hypothetical protein
MDDRVEREQQAAAAIADQRAGRAEEISAGRDAAELNEKRDRRQARGLAEFLRAAQLRQTIIADRLQHEQDGESEPHAVGDVVERQRRQMRLDDPAKSPDQRERDRAESRRQENRRKEGAREIAGVVVQRPRLEIGDEARHGDRQTEIAECDERADDPDAERDIARAARPHHARDHDDAEQAAERGRGAGDARIQRVSREARKCHVNEPLRLQRAKPAGIWRSQPSSLP